MKTIFILANSADPDEMLHNATFHLVFTVCQRFLLIGLVLIISKCIRINESFQIQYNLCQRATLKKTKNCYRD